MALSRRARRLHIGNLPIGVGLTGDMLKQFFNLALTSAGLHDTSLDGDPVIDVQVEAPGADAAPSHDFFLRHAHVRCHMFMSHVHEHGMCMCMHKHMSLMESP